MPRLDHLSLPVRDWQKSRDWYREHLGFELEFEIPDRKTAAMRDDADLTIFLYEGEVADCPGISFTIQVDDVEAKHDALVAAGRVLCPSADESVLGLRRRAARSRRIPVEALGSEVDERKRRWIAVSIKIRSLACADGASAFRC